MNTITGDDLKAQGVGAIERALAAK